MATYPTLKEIAATYEQKAQSLAPVKTGTMQRSIRVSYKKLGEFKYSFDLSSVAYIVWWNKPTISRTVRNAKTGNVDKINFVFKAAQSPEVRNVVNQYQTKAIIDVEVLGRMREYLENEGFGKVKQVYRKR
jgi:hypothetical protein